jgi:hypothetical protein
LEVSKKENISFVTVEVIDPLDVRVGVKQRYVLPVISAIFRGWIQAQSEHCYVQL